MHSSEVAEGLRPFLWLALAAFLVGFMSYLLLGRPAAPSTVAAYMPAASAPASDDWNLPKHI
jgi:hypothetical protein